MTRSRKKTPIVAVTKVPTEKPFKVQEHRRERSAVKQALATGEEPPHPREYGDPWKGERDGKVYLPDAPEVLRK